MYLAQNNNKLSKRILSFCLITVNSDLIAHALKSINLIGYYISIIRVCNLLYKRGK